MVVTSTWYTGSVCVCVPFFFIAFDIEVLYSSVLYSTRLYEAIACSLSWPTLCVVCVCFFFLRLGVSKLGTHLSQSFHVAWRLPSKKQTKKRHT